MTYEVDSNLLDMSNRLLLSRDRDFISAYGDLSPDVNKGSILRTLLLDMSNKDID
ncbi:hypothetical protein ACYX34_17565 [Nitrospira sp. CMX1]